MDGAWNAQTVDGRILLNYLRTILVRADGRIEMTDGEVARASKFFVWVERKAGDSRFAICLGDPTP